MDDAFLEGIRLFNSRQFFACHEALESLWLKEQGEEKLFLQGLIQVAAAFHHHARSNPQGAQPLLEEGWKKLVRFGETRRGVDLAGLRRQLQAWRDFFNHPPRRDLAAPAELPPLPYIQIRGPVTSGERGN
jgi:hypothetical protein